MNATDEHRKEAREILKRGRHFDHTLEIEIAKALAERDNLTQKAILIAVEWAFILCEQRNNLDLKLDSAMGHFTKRQEITL